MKKKWIIGLLASVICLGCTAVALTVNTQAQAASLDASVAFEKSYALQTEIPVPSSKITYEGKEYDANVKILYPDGSASLVTGESVKAVQSGVYTVVYYTVVDGKYVSVEKQFSVKNSAVTFTGDKSSYYYGAHSKYATTKEGLVVNVVAGETMQYNRIINLNELDGESVFSMFVTPESEPKADASRIHITFTDVYDASNSVTVRLKWAGNGTEGWSNNNTYCDAKWSEQDKFVGLEATTNPTGVVVAGGRYAVSRNGEYGSPIYFSMAGYIDSKYSLGDIEYGVAFDLENGLVYSNTETTTKLITQLNNSLLYTSLWEGFTTGEVFMSVSGANYEGGSLGLVFTDIAGHDLTADSFEVTTKPVVWAELAGYGEKNLPYAIVGKKYKIFEGSAYDVYDGNLTPTVKVFYGYHSNQPTRVGVENGCFKPTRAGVYTIEYSAVNANGIEGRYTVDVEAVKTDETLSISLDGKLTEGGIGQTLKVAESYALSNPSGETSVQITATLKNNPSIVYEIDESLTFVPYYAGVYEVAFAYSDYLFAKRETYALTITVEGGKPLIMEQPILPAYLIKGKTYTIPRLNGLVFTTGSPEEKACSVFLTEGNGEKQAFTETAYTVGNVSSVTVTYEISDGETTTQKPFVLQVIDVYEGTTFAPDHYFVSNDGGNATATSDCVELVAAQDSTWEFINLLVSKKVEWRVRLLENAMSFKYLDFYLTDAVNPEETVKFSFNQDGTYVNVRINDEDRLLITASLDKFFTSDLFLKYDEEFSLFTINNSSELEIEAYRNGKAFKGFSSGKVILKAGLSGVKAESKIAFRKINNQNIREMAGDKTMPIVYYTMHRGYQTVGDTVTLQPAVAGDVFDPSASLQFTVRDGNGNFVVALDGTLLNGEQPSGVAYSFAITQFGTYEVGYVSMDGNGAKAVYSYVIHSVDITAPTVNLVDAVRQAKVGETVKIAKVEMNDDGGEVGLKAFVTVILPNGVLRRLQGDAFTASEAGVYKVQYLVTDASGNVTMASYEITVS